MRRPRLWIAGSVGADWLVMDLVYGFLAAIGVGLVICVWGVAFFE